MPGVTGTVSHFTGTDFTYLEQFFGHNREIAVWIKSVKDASVTYKFKQNPHNEDSTWYNMH